MSYFLKAAVFHRGIDTFENGWYDAYVANDINGSWFYFDGTNYEQQEVSQFAIGIKNMLPNQMNDARLCMAVYERV